MKKRNCYLFLLGALCISACTEKSEKSVKGVIDDATMNTMVIITDQHNKISVNTTDADKTGVNGILIGDTATIFYTGKLAETVKATKIEVTPAKRPTIVGSWVQPIPGIGGEQGIKIEEGGKASSINMATLVYEKWQQPDDETLILSAKSIGNKVTSDFNDTLKLVKLTNDSLVLLRGENFMLRYSRQK